VDHALEIRNGGLLIVNDTVTLSTGLGETVEPLSDFLIGFPFRYRSNLDYCFAYDLASPDERFDVRLDVGLGRIGFYGVKAVFPESVDIGDGKSYSFVVIFVFSNLIDSWVPELEPENALFNVKFPMFPSLTQSISQCNVTINLPSNSTYLGISHLKDRELDFNKTMVPTREILTFVQSPLESFAYELGWLDFVQMAPSPSEYFAIFDATDVKRDVALDEWGRISVSDSYALTNKAIWNLTSITVLLPQGAYNVYARDLLGNVHGITPEDTNRTGYVSAQIPLKTELKEGSTTEFIISYTLPWSNYITHRSTSEFELSFNFLENPDLTVRELRTTVTLPKGANLRSSSTTPNIVKGNVFQETVTYTFSNVTPFRDLSFDIRYDHPPFWASFYPTLWMGVLVTIGGAVALLWRRAPTAPAAALIPVSSEALKRFVEAYEEKTKISSELESAEGLLRRGKVSRRRYKVRRKTLEGRLSALSRELGALREEMRAASPRFADIMGQVEVAEALLDGVERDFQRVEAQYKSGEISKGAYRRLISEYEGRRERAKTTIEGVLLRLREEIR
jgi:hypothetical protein